MDSYYRMTDRDIQLMIQLRATNEAIFTGRRNSAMRAWRAINKEMGLQGKLTARQLKKKWENMKEKYKVLKNPPEGKPNTTKPSSWRWFQLMDKAMSGRLAGATLTLNPSLFDEKNEEDEPDLPGFSVEKMQETASGLSVGDTGPPQGVSALGDITMPGGAVTAKDIRTVAGVGAPRGNPNPNPNPTECVQALPNSEGQTAILYATILSDCTAAAEGNCNVEVSEVPSTSISTDITMDADELERQIAELDTERQTLEREQAEIDREGLVLERERELLNREAVSIERERAAVDRDRAALDRDRAALDRDRVALDRDRVDLERVRSDLERDRAVLERDRAILERDRAFLERDRAVLERDRTGLDGDQAAIQTDKEVILQTGFYQSWRAPDLDPDQLETRQRLVSLFQKFIEKL